MPAGVNGCAIVRLSSLTLRLVTPASFSSRFASSRALAMSGWKPGSFFNSSTGQSERRTGPEHAADVLDQGDLAKARRSAPAIDRHGQRLTHADVVERLLLGVEGQQNVRHPWAFHDGDLVLHRSHELIALLWRAATELSIELPALNAGDDSGRAHEEKLVAVEIGFALVAIVRRTARRPSATP